MNKCGEGLKALFLSPPVQNVFNCIPMQEIGHDKEIYQPGVVRKVCICIAEFYIF